jgi:carboxyl-terminal processing protease
MQKPHLRTITSNITYKRVQLVLLAAAIFCSGVLVGQGNINIDRTARTSNTGLSKTLDFSEVDDVYQALRENYDGTLTEQQVLDGLKHGLAQSTKDPYTVFFTAKEANDFNSELQGTITGIGAQLELDQDSNVVVVAPLAGSPAEAAGLRAKDVIITVDGKSTSGMSVNDAVLKIRGEKDTTVKLGIVRNKTESLNFTITRDTIHIPTAVSKVLEGNIGYLQVSQFSEDTNSLVTKAVADFKAKNVTKVILDLRDNPGGEVSTAVQLSSLWLKSGDLIVQQKRGNTVIDSQYANAINTLHGTKTVVLVNGGSASASEITALALRDSKETYIIGEKTYGKGVVQQLIPFTDGSSLKVTIAKWYSPNGTNVNNKGITPDKIVTPTEDDYKNNNDVQLKAAEAWLQQN